MMRRSNFSVIGLGLLIVSLAALPVASAQETLGSGSRPVSYTHLTLPTIYSV